MLLIRPTPGEVERVGYMCSLNLFLLGSSLHYQCLLFLGFEGELAKLQLRVSILKKEVSILLFTQSCKSHFLVIFVDFT